MLPIPERVETLRQVPFLQDQTTADLEALLQVAEWQEVPRGSILMEEGVMESHLWIVVTGRVAATVGSGATMTILADVPRGEVVNAIALYRKNAIQPGRVAVVEDSILVRFDTMAVGKLAAAGSPLAMVIEETIIQTLTRRVRACNDAISEALQPTGGGLGRAIQRLRGILGG